MKLLRQYIFTREVFFNLLMFLMWGNMLLAYMRGFVGFIPGMKNYQDEAEMVVVTCIVAAALPAMINRMATIDWMFLFGCTGIYLLNMGVFVNNFDPLVENMFHTLCLTIPFFLFGRMLDVKVMLKPMTIISALCILLDAVYFLIYMRNPAKMVERMAGEYYMYQAYRLLPHVLFLYWRGLSELNWWKLLLGVLGTFLIIAYGTRGPLGCVGVFCIVYFFLYTKFRFSFVIKSILMGIAGFLVLFPQASLILLYKVLSQLDMSTRIVEKLLTGGILQDSGRGYIKLRLYEYLERPDTFWGYGLFGTKRFGVIYPHDYILDFIFSFGYVIGGLILAYTSYLIIKAYFVSVRNIDRDFLLLLLCTTILKYNFSSTYISEGLYFALLGFCTTIIISHHHIKEKIYKKP